MFEDVTVLVFSMQLSRSVIPARPGGSSERAAASSKLEQIASSEAESTRLNSSLTTETTSGPFRLMASNTRGSSPVLERKQIPSGRISSNLKNYDSALKGIESLNLDGKRRVHL